MKKVTYNGLIYTVEDESLHHYKLSGIGWKKKSECTHWLSGWFYKFFKGDWKNIFNLK